MTLFVLPPMSLLYPRSLPATEPTFAGTASAAVLAVVQEFFDAMQAKDADRLRATCQPGAQFTAARLAATGYVLRQRPIEADAVHFAETKDSFLERMWSPTVHVTGRIAVVWTRYDFHLNGKMSHNGTDCFTLLKTDQGWKIACGAYTLEPGVVTENPAGPPR
jgi:hypothetical protein